MARQLLYGITSDMRLLVGYATNTKDVIDVKGVNEYVAETHTEYPMAMAALMERYRQWLERNARTHSMLAQKIATAVSLAP